MNIRKSMMALAFAASCALAALPSTMLFQGHMPGMAGNKAVSVQLYDALTDGSLVWAESHSEVVFNDGYFALQLGSSIALPAFDKPLFVSLSVDGTASAARIPLTLAPYAKRAAVADSAVKADHATAADSAITAALATTAASADYATSAGSAKNADVAIHATRATTADVATNATHAASADVATSATTAVTADKAKALDASVHTLNLHGDASGAARVSQDTTEGSTHSNATLGLNAAAQEVYLSLSSGGNGAGSAASMIMTKDRISLGSSANYMGMQFSKIPDMDYTTLPACNEGNRGLMTMVYRVSNVSTMHGDMPAWCQYYSFPGGSGYRWVFMDSNGWKQM